TVLVGLALVGLSLRERPVVVARAVHEQHLPVLNDEPATGADERQLAARLSARHDARQPARASSRRLRALAMSSPAASAAAVEAPGARARSRSSATTASWCAP